MTRRILFLGVALAVAAIPPTEPAVVEPAVLAYTEPAAPSLWPAVQRLRTELWATRQQLARTRIERNQLATDLETLRRTLNATNPTLAEQDALWYAGYQAGGGTNPLLFADVILPCESGGTVSPHDAVGPTDDWGRAQLNKRTWATTFETRYGLSFETGSLNPVLNGHMAAYIEQVQSLTAWTCWRRR